MSQYSPAFYRMIREGTQRSAEALVPILREELLADLGYAPHVIDVGGGEGWWARAFRDLAGCNVRCLDGDYVEAPVVPFHAHDLTQPLPRAPKGYDLALCLEVAEHLPPERAESFVEDLCAQAPTVVFSAAVPGQGGTGHLNERWPDYWADLFQTHGYGCDDSLRWRIWNHGAIEPWYRQNLLVFRKDRIGALPAGVVHPIIFEHRRAA